MERRQLLQGLFAGGSAIALGGAALLMRGGEVQAQATATFPVTKSDAEWRKLLPRESYEVLRLAATEAAGTSPLLHEKRKGTFVCAGCALPLFASETKYDSRTGWPSFWQPITPKAIGTHVDKSHGMVRTECHCSRCGGHQGHIFDDGPRPTGLRYCINGVALKFVPAKV